MCGIFAILDSDGISDSYIEKLKSLIDARGPDHRSPVIEYKTRCGPKLRLAASVLHLRGRRMRKQPVVDEDTNILLFNGQIYAYDGKPLDKDLSDTQFLVERLSFCNTKIDVANVLSKIDGPFAIVYWSNLLDCLFYGRDLFGRKSLCTLESETNSNIPSMISSVGLTIDKKTEKWQEVDCRGFHCLDFSRQNVFKRTFYMWNIDNIYPKTEKCEAIKLDSDIEIYRSLKAPLSELNQDLRFNDEFSQHDHEVNLFLLEVLIVSAVRRRFEYSKDLCLICRQKISDEKCNHSKVALAFSGGIDSTVLAIALNKVVPKSETIDLITVAFKEDSPDRLSVGEAFKELRKERPDRNWRLVICDISLAELRSERDKIIRHLILPCNTVVDDSLGCGCWFISRARGRSLDSSMPDSEFDTNFSNFLKYDPLNSSSLTSASDKIKTTYESPASMIFAGMGIDEQLGGYTSHRAAWSKGGTRGLLDEIAFQMRRIPTRNLGRDDRTFSHHGRDLKLPFLDRELVSTLNGLPVNMKMDLSLSPEIGPKRLLRVSAYRAGLKATSRRVKRALQFGTRIASLENSDEKGNDICSRLQRLNLENDESI